MKCLCPRQEASRREEDERQVMLQKRRGVGGVMAQSRGAAQAKQEEGGAGIQAYRQVRPQRVTSRAVENPGCRFRQGCG